MEPDDVCKKRDGPASHTRACHERRPSSLFYWPYSPTLHYSLFFALYRTLYQHIVLPQSKQVAVSKTYFLQYEQFFL